MNTKKKKTRFSARRRRHARIRKKVWGTAERPRLIQKMADLRAVKSHGQIGRERAFQICTAVAADSAGQIDGDKSGRVLTEGRGHEAVPGPGGIGRHGPGQPGSEQGVHDDVVCPLVNALLDFAVAPGPDCTQRLP